MRVSWFSDGKRSDGIKLSLQIPIKFKARQCFPQLHVEKQPVEEYCSMSRTAELLQFCSVFDSAFSVSFTVSLQSLSQLAFPAQTAKIPVCQCPAASVAGE